MKKHIPEVTILSTEEIYLLIEDVLFSKKPLYNVIFETLKIQNAKMDQEIHNKCKSLREKSFVEFFNETNPELGEKLFGGFTKNQFYRKKGSYIGLVEFVESDGVDNVLENPKITSPREENVPKKKKDKSPSHNDTHLDADYLQASFLITSQLKKFNKKFLGVKEKTQRTDTVNKWIIESSNKIDNSFEMNLDQILSNPNSIESSIESKMLKENKESDEEEFLANKLIFKTAIAEMKKIQNCFTSRKKLGCIQKVVVEISNSFQKYLGTSFGADELVPVLEFILVHSELKNIQSQLAFIQNFSDTSLEEQMLGEIGYLIVSFEISSKGISERN